MGRAKKQIFQKKKRNTDAIFKRGGGKLVSPNKKWSGEIKKEEEKNWWPKKKWSGEIHIFFMKNFNHSKIEAANPSSIKLICCGLIKLILWEKYRIEFCKKCIPWTF